MTERAIFTEESKHISHNTAFALTDKLCLITGGGSGIGFDIAKSMIYSGAKVVITGRREEPLKAAIAELGKNAHYFVNDVTDLASLEGLVNEIESSHGPINILVNNAGVFIPGALCHEPEGQLERMMELNVYAAYAITRVIVPSMKLRQKGHIFNMCSVASLKAYQHGGSYSISKYALLGFSENLREELKEQHIKVTALNPGATYSRSWQGTDVSEERIMPPEDVAKILWATYNLSAQTDVEMVIMRPQFGDL
jgi:NADP-dependent 3-hydroxy acid dehydrogenase YdfG